MSMEEALILCRRAKTFLKYAKEALERRDFDFSCFSSEQSAQLFVKSVMLEVVGETPRTHRIRELLYLLSKSVPEIEKPVADFIKMNREVLKIMEDVYITSRYLPSPCTQEDAETLIKLVENLAQFIGKVLRSECARELLQS